MMFLLSSCNKSNPVVGDQPVYPRIDAYPAWSPDGKWIIYNHYGITRIDIGGSYTVNPDSEGLWIISPDGGAPQLVMKGSQEDACWSPDGRWIAFEAGAQIYKAPINESGVDTSGIVQLTFTGRNFFPAWSPDGQWVAYSNSIGDTVGIWISPANGSGGRSYFAFGGQPDWVPDGNALIYGNRGIWIERVDHSYKVRVITDSVNRLGGSKISSNGSKIVFESNVQIWVMNTDGTKLKQLTSDGGMQPSWSPDGQKIVYVGFTQKEYNPESNGTLWIMNSDGSVKYQLTHGPGQN